jgi:hypothetical protein
VHHMGMNFIPELVASNVDVGGLDLHDLHDLALLVLAG